MNNAKRIGSMIILYVISVAASIITAWQFMQIYATVALPVWKCVIGAACGALITVIVYVLKLKRKLMWSILPRLAVIAGLIVAVWAGFDEIVGGMAYIVNFSIDELNAYYGTGLYYIAMTEGMIRQAAQPLFAAIACGIAGYGYMSVLLNGKGVAAASLFAVFTYVFPATLEAAPSEWILLGVMSLVVCMVIQGERIKSRHLGAKRTSMLYAAIPVLVFSLAVTLIYMKAVPAKDYTMPGVFGNVRGKLFFSAKDIQTAIDGYRGSADSRNSSVGTGIIGRVDEMTYSDEPVFKVRAPKRGGAIYLKAFSGADYTKRRWKELGGDVYAAYDGMFDTMAESGKTPALSGYRAVSELTGMGAVGIKSAAYDIEIMQYTGDGNSYVPSSAIQADGISLDRIAQADKVIRLDGDDTGTADIRHSYRVVEWRNFSSLNKLVVNGGVLADPEDEYTRFVYDNYLGTDEACDDRIKNELFDLIMSSEYSLDTAAGKAQFILDVIDFLADNYEYTLSPGVTPSGKDYVEYFLFEKKKGLCTHFASAAAMILRSAGIPTRYVEGYVIPESIYLGNPVSSMGVSIRENGEFYKENWDYYEVDVTDRYAHAWIEVYVDGIGWITVDATPGYAERYMQVQNDYMGQNTVSEPESDTEDGSGQDESSSESRVDETDGESLSEPESDTDRTELTDETAKDESGSLGGTGENTSDKTQAESEAETADESNSGGIDIGELLRKAGVVLKPVAAVIWFIVRLAALPAAVVLFLVIRQKYMEQKRAKLYNDTCGLLPDERIKSIMNYYERLIRHAGAADVPDRTTAEISAEMFGGIADTDEVFAIVDKAMYSKSQPDEDEIMKVMAYVDNVRGKVYCRLNLPGRLWFKYILLL